MNHKPKILVIDDDTDLRTVLKLALQRLGFTVIEAKNGSEGMKLVEEMGPDLVLTDIVMPDQDGIETIQMLRSNFPGIKVIAMSGGGPMSADELLRVATNLRVNGCLTKPFDNESLRVEIQKALSKAA